jgi:predicted lipoprotein with Yx(FWY)xxD motif
MADQHRSEVFILAIIGVVAVVGIALMVLSRSSATDTSVSGAAASSPGCHDLDKDGYSSCGGDCNDNDPSINPRAKDICGQRDMNCDGKISC